MNILAIDTSCDDTCISIVNVKCQMSNVKTIEFNILSNIVSSQVKIHQKYGGVYPFLAKREHQRNLPIVLKKALKEAGSEIPNSQFLIPKIDPVVKFGQNFASFVSPKAKQSKFYYGVDIIAVTVGPGLEPCLWEGVNFAKALSYLWSLPIMPVNHIEAHILANFLNTKYKILNTKYLLPAVCLVVSGGHTQLILMTPVRKASLSNGARRNWKYKIIGETRDDAAGECFDKTARILGLGYPGGPAIAAEAVKLSTIHYKLQTELPRPMINSKDYDFSFSGLKTAVLYNFKKRARKVRTSKEYIKGMAKEIQQAIIDVLIKKTIKAAKDYRAKSIILGGGVAANQKLRRQFKEKIRKEIPNTKYYLPNTKYCTDNAAMIGIAGYFNREKASKDWKKIKVNANLRI